MRRAEGVRHPLRSLLAGRRRIRRGGDRGEPSSDRGGAAGGRASTRRLPAKPDRERAGSGGDRRRDTERAGTALAPSGEGGLCRPAGGIRSGLPYRRTGRSGYYFRTAPFGWKAALSELRRMGICSLTTAERSRLSTPERFRCAGWPLISTNWIIIPIIYFLFR